MSAVPYWLREAREAAHAEALALRAEARAQQQDLPRPARPAPGWKVEAGCERCGVPLEHLADGRSDGREALAMAVCPKCRMGHRLLVRLDSNAAMARAERSLDEIGGAA